ncbi:MAG TPA: hypothetical protein VIP46_22080 [Pyrinomonadaceae bacterium]
MLRDHTLRMGRVMPYTSADGALHPESFWCMGPLSIDPDLSQIKLRFVGYHSVAAYNEGHAPVAGALKEYHLFGADYMASIGQGTRFPTGTQMAAEILTAAWSTALSVKDVIVPPEEEGGDAVHVSFFEQATDAGL